MADQDLLPMSGGAMNASRVSDATTPRLTAILTGASDAHEAAQFIIADEMLLSEARHILPLVQRLAKPMAQIDIRIALQPLLLMFDPPSFGRGAEAEQLEGAWEQVYLRTLTGLPKEALDHAVSEWCKIGKTFPKPAHLRELADPVHMKIAASVFRLKKAVELGDKAWRSTPSQSPEERQKVKDGLKALMAELGASRAVPEAQRLGSDPHQAAERLRAHVG